MERERGKGGEGEGMLVFFFHESASHTIPFNKKIIINWVEEKIRRVRKRKEESGQGNRK